MAVALRHGPDCDCDRCLGAQSGNQLARKHGGYSLLGIGDRATRIADEIRETMPARADADEPVLLLLATTLARIERANAALIATDDTSSRQRLSDDLRSWINTARRLANDLGLTPTSRARLGLDIAATQRSLSVLAYYEQRERAGLPVHDDEEVA
jgi:hypothetical protein